MKNNFDIKKFLKENKMTFVSKTMQESTSMGFTSPYDENALVIQFDPQTTQDWDSEDFDNFEQNQLPAIQNKVYQELKDVLDDFDTDWSEWYNGELTVYGVNKVEFEEKYGGTNTQINL
jgi:hypothetical protein